MGKLGQRDPYYGVFSVHRFRRETLTDNLDEFFTSGQGYVAGRLALTSTSPA